MSHELTARLALSAWSGLRSSTVMDIVLGEFKRVSLQDLDMCKAPMFDDYRSEEAIEAARQAMRRQARFNFFKADGTVSVAVDGAVVTLPEGVEAALEHIRREDSFTPESLPGLEHESRLIFAQSMLDCRLVERIP